MAPERYPQVTGARFAENKKENEKEAVSFNSSRSFNRADDPSPSCGVTMMLNGVSVFDPSPSEKLQLVEDLWDDLAATPDTVPVHDWWGEVKRKVRSLYGR